MGDVASQMLRDFHVPEEYWSRLQAIWWLVQGIVFHPDNAVFYPEMTGNDREALTEYYKLGSKAPPDRLVPLKELYANTSRSSYRQKIKELADAQNAVARILRRRSYREWYISREKGDGAR